VNVTLRRSIATAAAVLAVPMLSSCGLAFTAQTDQIYNPTIGVNNRTGEVDVLNALVVTRNGGSGTLIAGLVNNNERQADALTGVTGAKQDAGLTVQTQGAPITIPANGLYQLADKGDVSVFGSELTPGSFVWVTFNFAHAKSITVEVPVVTPYNGLQQVPLPSTTTPAPPTPTATPLHKKHKKHQPSASSSPTS
jgi:hypothetical protein